MEDRELAPKVRAIYQAVIGLLVEGADLNNLTVAEIATRAGIGKGTVYEYFPNKEEMIAEALFNELKSKCRELYEQVEKEKNLYAKMDLVLVNMEKKMAEINCFVRVMHIMLDNSAISSRMRRMALERKEGDILVIDIVERIIDNEMGSLKDFPEEKRIYLQMTVFSKMICFALYQFDTKAKASVGSGAMRAMICQDMCRDIENLKREDPSLNRFAKGLGEGQ